MKYEIKLSAPCGEIVPLVAVASAKAHFRATAGGTDFHKPAYDGSFTRFADDLLREAKCGRLKVCDQWGIPGESDALIADAKRSGDLMEVIRYVKEPDWERLQRENEPIAAGVWNLTHLDLGPSAVDWTSTHLSALCTTLRWLDEWGESRGDEFKVTHEGVEWADERGIHLPRRLRAANEAGAAPAAPRATASEPMLAPGAAQDLAGGTLKTTELAEAFDGIHGASADKWRKRLGDVNKHSWLTPARATTAPAPKSATWWPLKFAELLLARGCSADSLNRAFHSVPALKPWRHEWQEALRERNAFGQ